MIIKIPDNYDFYINCTIYNDQNVINDGKHFYICHEVQDYLLNNPHIFYLTPLLCGNFKYIKCNILPYQNEKIIFRYISYKEY